MIDLYVVRMLEINGVVNVSFLRFKLLWKCTSLPSDVICYPLVIVVRLSVNRLFSLFDALNWFQDKMQLRCLQIMKGLLFTYKEENWTSLRLSNKERGIYFRWKIKITFFSNKFNKSCDEFYQSLFSLSLEWAMFWYIMLT